jgi:hypothetical protein
MNCKKQIVAVATAQAGHLRSRQLGFDIANLLSFVAVRNKSVPCSRLREPNGAAG